MNPTPIDYIANEIAKEIDLYKGYSCGIKWSFRGEHYHKEWRQFARERVEQWAKEEYRAKGIEQKQTTNDTMTAEDYLKTTDFENDSTGCYWRVETEDLIPTMEQYAQIQVDEAVKKHRMDIATHRLVIDLMFKDHKMSNDEKNWYLDKLK